MVQLHSARYDTQGSALVWQSSFSSSATALLTMPVYRQCCKGVLQAGNVKWTPMAVNG
jgi:hypothetical protein